MSAFVRAAASCVLLGIAGCATTPPPAAAVTLSGVPDSILLPTPPGRNAVVTAIVSGGVPKAVWIAKDRGSPMRYELAAAGDRSYPFNLADAELAVFLGASGGTFRVFAETADGRRAESPPVAYGPSAPPGPIEVELFADTADGSIEIERTSPDWGTRWLDPSAVRELRVRPKSPAVPCAAVARAGREDIPFEPSREKASIDLTLPMTDGLRDRWVKSGEISILHGPAGQRPEERARLRAIPAALEFPAAGEPFTVTQRGAGAVPGSRGFLEIALDAITAGQVLLTLRDGNGTPRVAKRVRGGESVEFALGKETYSLQVVRLVNILIGDDWGEFQVLRARSPDADEIGRLLRAVEVSGVTFIREEREYGPAEAAKHMRAKITASAEPVRTAEEFIERIATRSSLTKRDYQVRLADGKTVPSAEWLRARLADIRKGKDPAPPKAPEPTKASEPPKAPEEKAKAP